MIQIQFIGVKNIQMNCKRMRNLLSLEIGDLLMNTQLLTYLHLVENAIQKYFTEMER